MGSGVTKETKKIDLSNKGIKTIGEVKNLAALETVEALQAIDLSKNKLTEFSEYVITLLDKAPRLQETLTHIVLRKNRFSQIPKAIYSICALPFALFLTEFI